MKTSGLHSYGILLLRKRNNSVEVLLLHPGGPFFARKNEGAWSIPKGLAEDGESPVDAARREFEEETGSSAEGEFKALNPVKLKSGKTVHAYVCESDFDTVNFKSNFFEIEWPKNSGKIRKFPEADKAAWFSLTEAMSMINAGQVPLLRQVEEMISKNIL